MSIGKLVEQNSGKVFPLGFDVMTIGRHDSNTIILPDPQVSRHHSEIVMQGGRWVIRDLNSANGTFVNGQQIVGPQVLNHSDMVRVGKTSFRVEIPAAVAHQDTMVEKIPPQVLAPAPVRNRSGLIIALVAVAAIAILVVGVLVIWPLLRGDDVTPDATALPGTSVASGSTDATPTGTPSEGGASSGAQTPVKPTETAIPTIAPPTATSTSLPPTEAPPTVTDTPPPAPEIGSFQAKPPAIERGECTRLEWGGVENANRITLSDVGQVGATGKVDVCLQASKTYILEVTGAGGTTQKSVKVTVQEPPGPVIEYFRAVPSIVSPGGCAQLEWGKVENATSASIEPGIGGVGTPGTQEVCPGSTTTYVLTAQNASGTRTAQTTLNVSTGTEPKPVIPFFTANPASIEAGECTTLEWGKVDYATAVTIDNNIGGVATPGSKEVCLGTTTTFVMAATGPGGTTEFNLKVSVSPGKLANLPDVVVESILFEPNPCYRGQKCKVRVTVRNDGPVAADHFVVRWAPEGQGQIPVEWDVDSLAAGQKTELVYPWIPSRVAENWRTVAIADLNEEVAEIEEGAANSLEQYITVLEP